MNTTLENQVLNLLRGVNITAPTTVYLGLFGSDPTAAGTQTSEVSTTNTGYSRQAITFGTAASGGSISNTADVLFTATSGGAGFGTVGYVGIMDAASAGNMLWHGALAASKTVNAGDSFKVASGSLTVSIS